MDDEAAVAEVGTDTIFCRDKLIVVCHVERILVNLAVLAAQVADLASLGEPGVAGGFLATDEGIEMSQRLRAVAVGRDRVDVDVVS